MGAGTIGMIEVIGISNAAAEVTFSAVILGTADDPPVPFPMILGSLAVNGYLRGGLRKLDTRISGLAAQE